MVFMGESNEGLHAMGGRYIGGNASPDHGEGVVR